MFLFLGQEPILFCVPGFGVLFFRLETCLSVSQFGFWVFDFVCMLLFRVLDFYFQVLSVCFVLRASRETFSFLHFIILFYI